MSTPTTTSSIEVEEYCEAVRQALTDLPVAERDELLEDLPDHLAEVLAEGDGTLRERLGAPGEYAAELRIAAGLPPVDAGDGAGAPAGLRAALGRAIELTGRADRGLGRLVGYARLQDLLRAARPGWWLLRGWIVAQFICGARSGHTWRGFVPVFDGSRAVGAVVLVVALVASVWLGRQTSRFARGWRAAVVVAGLVIAVWGGFLAAHVTGSHSTYVTVDDGSEGSDGSGVSDVYVYDQNGNLVPNARLYDVDGSSIQLGDRYCDQSPTDPGIEQRTDADAAPADGVDGAGNPVAIYPLCPKDPGPFRSGPGALVSPGAPTPAPSSTPAPASSPPAARSTPTPSPTPTPTPTPTTAPAPTPTG